MISYNSKGRSIVAGRKIIFHRNSARTALVLPSILVPSGRGPVYPRARPSGPARYCIIVIVVIVHVYIYIWYTPQSRSRADVFNPAHAEKERERESE